MSLKETALEWWAEQTKQNVYVVSSGKIPDQRHRDFLKKKGLIFRVARGSWILKRPEDEIDDVFLLLYWQAIENILAPHDWSLGGASALSIYNGDHTAQRHLMVRTKDKTNRKISLLIGFDIELRYRSDFDDRLIRRIDIAGRKIPVDIPERTLVDVSRLKSKDVLSFVAGTKFDPRVFDAIYANNPKPVVFKRLVGLATEAKRDDLAARLQKTVEDHTAYRIVKKPKRESGHETSKPAVIVSPWVIRQEERAKEFEEALTNKLKLKIARIKKQPIKQLLDQARDHKKYDTYHSTSLEGYRITPEDVEALLSGRIPKKIKEGETEYFEKLRNQMAIVGYSEAFDFILEKAESDFNKPQITEDFIKDAYYSLFKPSADAGILDYHSLTAYRNIPVYIRGTRYAPPSYEKLPELMASYEKLVNEIQNPVVKAILAHYFFVAIHPYTDGNGRTGRLLMNYFLLSAAFSWVTIKNEQREQYFETLRKAQLEEDILPFGEFIVGMLKEASKDGS